MRWVDALKLYNQGKGGWCIPRKGTKEYDEVRKIMGGSKPAPPTDKAMRAESKPKHLKEDVLGALRKVAEDAKHRNADKAKKLLAMMEEKKTSKSGVYSDQIRFWNKLLSSEKMYRINGEVKYPEEDERIYYRGFELRVSDIEPMYRYGNYPVFEKKQRYYVHYKKRNYMMNIELARYFDEYTALIWITYKKEGEVRDIKDEILLKIIKNTFETNKFIRTDTEVEYERREYERTHKE